MNQPNPVSDLGVEMNLGSLFSIASPFRPGRLDACWIDVDSQEDECRYTRRPSCRKLTLPAWPLRTVAPLRVGWVCLIAGKLVLSRVLCFVAKVSVKLSESLDLKIVKVCLVICIAVQLTLENGLHFVVFDSPRVGGDASFVVVLSLVSLTMILAVCSSLTSHSSTCCPVSVCLSVRTRNVIVCKDERLFSR